MTDREIPTSKYVPGVRVMADTPIRLPEGIAIEDVWWSCEIAHYSVADDWGDHAFTSSAVAWQWYRVDRATPKGVWLKLPFGGQFFVQGKAIRQRASPTPALALRDAIAKKERHVAGCESRLKRAVDDLDKLTRTKNIYPEP